MESQKNITLQSVRVCVCVLNENGSRTTVRMESYVTFRVTVHTIPESQAGGSPRLVLRVPRGWGEAQAGDIRFYTLRYLSPRLGGSPRLVLRVPRGWGEAQAGDIRLNRLERIENYRTDRELYNV